MKKNLLEFGIIPSFKIRFAHIFLDEMFKLLFKNRNFKSLREHSIEFELNNFDQVCNQNKEIDLDYSPKQKFDVYDWSIGAKILKYQNNNELWFLIRLRCESDDQSNFPLYANIKYSILNKDKDSRKDYSQSNLFFY